MDEQPTQPEDIGYHLESLVETSDIGFDYLKLLSVKWIIVVIFITMSWLA